MKDVHQILAEINARLPLAEIEANLRAEGHDQTVVETSTLSADEWIVRCRGVRSRSKRPW
jgi:hypothetical protein